MITRTPFGDCSCIWAEPNTYANICTYMSGQAGFLTISRTDFCFVVMQSLASSDKWRLTGRFLLTKMLGSGSFGQPHACKRWKALAFRHPRIKSFGLNCHMSVRIYIAKDSEQGDREVALKLEVKDKAPNSVAMQFCLAVSGLLLL